MKTALPIAQALQKRTRRPSESLEDGRRWAFGNHEFASACWLMVITPSEVDVIELGQRTAVAYCDEFAQKVQEGATREARLLHPVEYPRGVFA